jgi:CheY-like chemotaxis protein
MHEPFRPEMNRRMGNSRHEGIARDWMFLGLTPLIGQESFVEAWPLYWRIFLVGIMLCMVAIIILAVPPLFDYIRHWRERCRMESLMRRNQEEQKSSPTISESKKDAIKPFVSVMPNALGWDREEMPDAVATSQPELQKNILVADDDPVVMLALSQRLQHLGYSVMRSPDAMHALLGAIKIRPDLVILDVNMPSGNGLAVCEMMASDQRYSGIPVIIHSIVGDEATRQRCRQLGAYHIEKSTRS